MTFRQTCFVLCLPALYLTCELAFNARLLDVVGGGATEDQIHSIEQFGRSLSGIALALFMLQAMLYFQNWGNKHQNEKKPLGFVLTFATVSLLSVALPFFALLTAFSPLISACASISVGFVIFLIIRKFLSGMTGFSAFMFMVGVCGVFSFSVYFSLGKLTDHLSNSSTPEFRHASSNIVLIQGALVDGRVNVDGLSDDPFIFSRPEGKAFLALFPVMAVYVYKLDEKIRGVKSDLISDDISKRAGGPQGMFKKYMDGVKETHTQFKKYEAASRGVNFDQNDVQRQQEQAWNDYKARLYKRGWNPYTVPDKYRQRVVRDVQSKVPVPNDWELTDEEGFKAAVEQKMMGKGRGRSRANGVTHNGRTIPFGLSWPEFFAHPAVQDDLRKKMGLPSGIVLKPNYNSGSEFERTVFDVWLNKQTKKRLEVYDAPVKLFADGMEHADEGKKMARAAIVPPMALFFSLLGAIAHLGKFAYLFLKVTLWKILQREKSNGKGKLGVVLLGGVLSVIPATGMTLRTMDNDVTKGRIYNYLQNQVREEGGFMSDVIINAGHIVAVGQGVFYPLDEKIRTDVLAGFNFGYEPAKKNAKLN